MRLSAFLVPEIVLPWNCNWIPSDLSILALDSVELQARVVFALGLRLASGEVLKEY